MGLAPVGHLLYTKYMNYNPKNPLWVSSSAQTMIQVLRNKQSLNEKADGSYRDVRPIVIASCCPTDMRVHSSTSSSTCPGTQPRWRT